MATVTVKMEAFGGCLEHKRLQVSWVQARQALHKAMTQLETSQEVQLNLKIFRDRGERLFKLDQDMIEVASTLLEEEDFFTFMEDIDVMKDRYIAALHHHDQDLLEQHTSFQSADSSTTSPATRKNFKLPKLELQKFNGDPTQWIRFWAQFTKVHSDEAIADEDKFMYLIQCMVPGSKAAELVASFPPSALNYQKVIQHLKDRFARDGTLIEVYVRELLALILKGKDLQLSTLYTKLSSQLRALESLGVTTEKFAAMLLPLAEATLPDDLMKCWERFRYSQNTGSSTGGNETLEETTLKQLLEFLKKEVESEDR